jgi:anti-sigma regulatory factor (Ser/Thr protein kinase)
MAAARGVLPSQPQMRSRRALCVALDGSTRAAVEQSLAAAALEVEHVAALPEPSAVAPEVAVVVVSPAARQRAGEALRALPVPVAIVGDHLEDDAVMALLCAAPVSHLVEDPADPTLEVAGAQLASGQVRGLEAYLGDAAGPVHERAVRDARAKRHAIDEVCAWAAALGARRALLPRLASVVDELLMNALIAGADGGAEPDALLRWGASARTIGIAVRDARGALRQDALIEHVRRARLEGGRPLSAAAGDGPGGAGLGLYLVLANTEGLVVNVAPGERTEVVCLFERQRAPGARLRRRALHVFARAP